VGDWGFGGKRVLEEWKVNPLERGGGTVLVGPAELWTIWVNPPCQKKSKQHSLHIKNKPTKNSSYQK